MFFSILGSMSVNVSTSTKTGSSETFNAAGQFGNSGSVQTQPDRFLLNLSILVLFVQLSIFTSFLH